MTLIKRISQIVRIKFYGFTLYSAGKKVCKYPIDFNQVFIHLIFSWKSLSAMWSFALICGLNFVSKT